jgi:hypothetical protein
VRSPIRSNQCGIDVTEANTNKNTATRRTTVAPLDALEKHRGSRNRGQVMQLIEHRRPTAQKK